MTLNGSSIRNTARVLKISPPTVIEELKKLTSAIGQSSSFGWDNTRSGLVRLCQWEDTEAELDEMWSFVGNKQQERWLLHAIVHQTGTVLAYVLSNDIKMLRFSHSKRC